jgi:REP element-mobilizing transposase RayT
MAMHSDDAMTDYRRLFVPGATYFFTADLLDRRSQLLVMNTTSLRHASAYTMQHHPFSMDAIVTLPDHIHTIWTLPPDDDDFPLRWRLIKSTFTRLIPKARRRRPADARSTNAAYGSADIGSIAFATMPTLHAILTTGISIRRSTDI